MTIIPDRIGQWLPLAQPIGTVWSTDPLDLLAVIARESDGDPNAQSPDGGLGLMQITRKFHPTFCDAVGPDGKPLWRVPAWNIFYGASLLYWLKRTFDGSGYDARLCAICGYNASVSRIWQALRTLTQPVEEDTLIASLDQLTTHKNYVSDVLAKRASYIFSQ